MPVFHGLSNTAPIFVQLKKLLDCEELFKPGVRDIGSSLTVTISLLSTIPIAIEDAKKSLQWDLDYDQMPLWENYSTEQNVDA